MDAAILTDDFPAWQDLKTIAVAASYKQERGKVPSLEFRYYISSASLTEQELAKTAQEYWGIESCHWILDITIEGK